MATLAIPLQPNDPAITLPPYQVNLAQFARKETPHCSQNLSFFQRIQKIVWISLICIKCIFVVIPKATREIFSYIGISFKHIVLGYYGSFRRFRPPQNFYLAIFKVVIWVFAVGWCWITTVGRLVYERMQNKGSARLFLQTFAGREINLAHIQTKELIIDVSHVPASVQVNRLYAMFDAITFDDSKDLNYIDPSNLRDGGTEHSREEFRKYLETFVKNVEGRIAFLGTPPSYDTPRLMKFYQQIEDSVRFCIDKVERDITEFQGKYGSDPTKYDEERRKEFKNLSETRARVALNLALAGKYCGARFMGEAMELYHLLKGDALVEDTLQNCLFELLASKRNEIARQQIQDYFGSSTHGYTEYFATFGSLLALPGAQNVVEQLSHRIDRFVVLTNFFANYTVDCILDMIQEKVKTSQNFREKIFDWLRDQAPDVNQETNEAHRLIEEVEGICSKQTVREDYSLYKAFKDLQQLIEFLQCHSIEQDLSQSIGDDLSAFFLLAGVRKWLENRCGTRIFERAQTKQRMQNLFSNEQLGKSLTQKVQKALHDSTSLDYRDFHDRLLKLQKVVDIQSITEINIDTIHRVLDQKKSFRDAIIDAQRQKLGNEFLGQLNLENITKEGLSPQMLEWITVSNGILWPQL